MVKEHTLNMVLSFTLMGESMWGNTRMGKSGTEHITTITGKKNGQGTYTWSDGSKYVGEWKGGEMWNGTIYDKDGNIIKKVVNGKMINQ